MPEDLEAARDYWTQIYSRLCSDPMATLVERDRVIADISSRSRDSIVDAYGFPPDAAEQLKRQYIADVTSAPITSPGVNPHAERILADLCARVEEACVKLSLEGRILRQPGKVSRPCSALQGVHRLMRQLQGYLGNLQTCTD